MGKNTRKRYPVYYEEFKCIGGKCVDSCCIGWNIDIDKTTFKQYFKVKEPEMKKMFQKNIQNNQNCSCDEIDYGIVKLKKDRRCPFLDEENYCVIHSNLGEEYLSNVCTCFPRLTNKIDDKYEMSLDVACPEAARLILLNKDGIKFEEENGQLGKHILSNVIDTKSKAVQKLPIKYFLEIRDFCIEILQDRRFEISERIYALGCFIENIEEVIENNFNNVSNFIKKYDITKSAKSYSEDDLNSLLGNINMNYLIQIDFFRKMLKILKVDKEVESIRFKDYTHKMLKGYNFEKNENINDNAGFYIKAFEEFNEKYFNEHSYIFENYLVNYIYNNMFPFNEVMSFFDSYMMLLMRFSFIRFYLVGLSLNDSVKATENIVDFIQVFSKTIEHHRSYLIDSLHYIKRNDYDNIQFVKTLL